MTSSIELSKSCKVNPMYRLAAPKNCGMLMLINKLLRNSKRNSRQLAEELLRMLNRSSIAILPSSNDNAIDFVSSLIEQAKRLAHHPNDKEKIKPYAKRFVEELETSPESGDLEKLWKDFTFIFFQEKLRCQQ